MITMVELEIACACRPKNYHITKRVKRKLYIIFFTDLA